MNLTIPNWLTTLLTGVLSAIPLIVPLVPPPYNAAATAGIAFLGALYHLYQTPPGSVVVPAAVVQPPAAKK